MANNNFMEKFRAFFGLRQEPPRNDFRNPIWSSDDEDDGDELYTKHHIKLFDQTEVPDEMQEEFTRQMQDMLRSFGTMFGDMKTFFHDESVDSFTCTDLPDQSEPENFSGNNIRDYYLKPGYHNHRNEHPKEDIDLDGKVSSHEISGLLKQKKDSHNAGPLVPFNGSLVPGRSFCQTIITTSVTKPDGSVETRRIVKNGNEVIEETTTTSGSDNRGPVNPGLDQMLSPGLIYSNIMSELSSLFRNFY